MLTLSFDRPNRFGPSRSAVMSTQGMVVTSQPLAALVGVDVLRQGGNAIDAAIAAAALLNVIEPMSTGVGGDAFALIYEAKSGKVFGLNASGRSPYAATLDEYQRRVATRATREIPPQSLLAATVPGTVDGWATAIERFGHRSLADVLAPAIRTAEEGFAVAPQTAPFWAYGRDLLWKHPDSAKTWLYPDGRTPQPGEVFKNPYLARTLRLIAEGGRDAFYNGDLADAIVRFSEMNGGLFSHADFVEHTSTWVEPISIQYRGYDIVELPPNGQGVAALEALQILTQDDLAEMGHNTADTIHLQLEATTLALHDAKQYITDPEFVKIPIQGLLSADYARQQRARISTHEAIQHPTAGVPPGGDTVYICAVDAEGNVVSFINSIFVPWGTGLTVGGTGVLLQNRGSSFSLDPNHVNVIAPHKRTRHTIIPAMMLHNGKPLMTFGFVGGDMQVQAHVQFICNVVNFGMNLQDALDAPRWQYNGTGSSIALEAAIASDIWDELKKRGHEISGSAGFFGGGQAIMVHPEYGTLQGGSDSRRDGCAIGY
ncbi:MAG: gamma-glutamyltransferase [Acidobacteria bacterium]|nr:gamma-glutamyltransferase [Acidobacteriota bacterium]